MKKRKRKTARALPVEDLLKVPFQCANCSSVIIEQTVKLYCSEVCGQEAEWVRYVRACSSDGRVQRPDVLEAIEIRLASILGGGYSKKARRLPDSLRQLIIERDRGRCRVCGEPGTEIDHISGSSSDPENLQLLCDACHNEKTKSRFVRITPESHPEACAKAQWLRQRASALQPLLICDSQEWRELQKELMRKRRELRLGLASDQNEDSGSRIRRTLPVDRLDT